MAEPETIPHQLGDYAVRSFAVSVVAGPDKGKAITAASDVLTIGTGDTNDLVLSDSTVSRYHLELRRVRDRILLADNGSTNGVEAGGVLIERGTVRPGSLLRLGRTTVKVEEGEAIQLAAANRDQLGTLRGRTPAMRHVFALIENLCKSAVPVLVLGETGSGKEGIARAIHDGSPRKVGPFEVVDCGTLLSTLIASELFGHERGAFTGATSQHQGAFERANGGTLFLDEIGELPLELQPALLGVLERKTIKRVGGTEQVPVDVRVVAATHQDLRALVNSGRFRQDLYYRLAVVPLRVPPLRERPEDLELLIGHFIKEAGREEAARDLYSPAVLQGLKAHPWPGNVRELRNFVEATLLLGEMPSLGEDGRPLPRPTARSVGIDPALLERPYSEARGTLVEAFEAAYLDRLLERAEGNVSLASRLAGMNRSYLRELIARHRPEQ